MQSEGKGREPPTARESFKEVRERGWGGGRGGDTGRGPARAHGPARGHGGSLRPVASESARATGPGRGAAAPD